MVDLLSRSGFRPARAASTRSILFMTSLVMPVYHWRIRLVLAGARVGLLDVAPGEGAGLPKQLSSFRV
jgi:hypothetical protein